MKADENDTVMVNKNTLFKFKGQVLKVKPQINYKMAFHPTAGTAWGKHKYTLNAFIGIKGSYKSFKSLESLLGHFQTRSSVYHSVMKDTQQENIQDKFSKNKAYHIWTPGN